MFKYLINGELFVFSSEEERDDILEQARANEYTIELVKEKEKVASDDTILNPDFPQDAAKSADVVSGPQPALDTDSGLEDGSLELPLLTEQEQVDLLQYDNKIYGNVLNKEGDFEYIEQPYQSQIDNYRISYNDALTAQGNFSYLENSSEEDRQYVADTMIPKPTYLKNKFNYETNSYEQVPTEEASKAIEKNLPNNFSKIYSKEQFNNAIELGVSKTLNEDPLVNHMIKQNERQSKQELSDYAVSLSKKYNFDDPEELRKAEKDWENRAKQLIIDPVVNSKAYKNTVGQLVKVSSDVIDSKNIEFGRFKSDFLSSLDGLSNLNIPGSEIVSASIESVAKGGLIIKENFNNAQVGIDQVKYQKNNETLLRLEKDIENGTINENDSASFGGTYSHKEGYTIGAKKGTVKEKIEFLKKEIKNQAATMSDNLTEAAEARAFAGLMKSANLEDGIDLMDMVRLIGESAPQMAAATAGTLTGNPVLAGLGFMTMATTEYGNNYIGTVEQGLINDNIEVNQENILKALSEGKYANQAASIAGAALSASLESLGGISVASKTLKALGLSSNITKGAASLYKGEIKTFAKNLYRNGKTMLKGGRIEALTELGQGLTGQITKGVQLDGIGGFANYIDNNENYQSFVAGGAMGIFLPFAGAAVSQSKIELRNAARDVATKFDFQGDYAKDLRSVNTFFRTAENNLNERFALNELTEQEYKEELTNLNESRNIGYKIPKELSETGRKKAFDLILEKTQIEKNIKGKEPELVVEEKNRILQINSELNDISNINKASKTAKKILKGVGKGNTKYISLGTKEEVKDWIKENTGKSEEEAVSQSTSYGLNVKSEGQPDIIIINEETIFESGKSGRLKNNTSAHEVLHTILNEAVGAEQMAKMGNELASAVKTALGDQYASSEFGMRYEQYVALSEEKDEKGKPKYSKEQLGQEAFTLLSEALLDNKLNFDRTDQSFISKLKEIIKNVYANVIGRPIEFNTTEDLFDFIESYNKSITSGKGLSGRVKATIEKGAKGAITTKDTSVSSSLSSDVEQRINQAEDLLNEAEDAFNEDPNNPQAEKAFNDATAAYNALLEGEAEIAEDVVEDEIVTETKAEDFIQKKKDPSTKKRSLTSEQRQEVEDKIVKAKALSQNLRTEEKKAIAEKVKEIENISNKEMRRSEQKRLIDLAKNNPVEFAKQQGITVQKPAGLAALEKEIANDLKVPIDKFVNSVGVLFYKMQKPQVRDTIDLNTFLDVVRGDVLSIAINEFNPESTNRQGEKVINNIEDIIFSRGGLRIRDVSERLITGKEKTDSTKEIKSEEVSDVKKIKPSSILSGTKNKYNRAKELVQEFWKKNEGTKKLESFKGLKSVIDDVIVEVFDITPSALSARSGNLNRSSMNNALKNITKPLNVIEIRNADGSIETARVDQEETSDFIDDLNRRKLLEKNDPEYIEGYTRSKEPTSILDLLTKFFPESTVPEYFYANGERGRAFNTATGIGDRLKEAFYVNRGRSGKTSGNTQRDLSDVTFDEMLEVIGAYKDTDGVFRFKAGVSGRSPEGLRLLELVKLTGKYITNELSRTETNLDPMTKADIAAGKSSVMFSVAGNVVADVLQLAKKDVEAVKRVTNIESAKTYIKDVIKIVEVLDSADNIVLNKTTFSTRTKIIANNIRKENTDITIKQSNKKALEITNYIKSELDKLKKSGVLKPRKEVGTTTLAMQYPKKSFKNYTLAINQGSLIEKNRKHAEVMRNSYMKIYEDIAKAKEKNDPEALLTEIMMWARFTEAASMERTHLLAMGAPAIGYQAGIKASDTKAFEHAFPVADMGSKLLSAAIESDTKEQFSKKYDELAKNYVIIGLSKDNANKVNKAGYNSVMPKDSKFWWQRYLNEEVFNVDGIGIDPFNIFVRNDKNEVITLSEYAGWVDAKGVELSDKQKSEQIALKESEAEATTTNFSLAPKILRQKSATNEESIQQLETIDRAITIANSLDIPNKGISVWDFDDTLARSKSNVLYTMPDGSKGKLTAEQFAKDGDRLMAEGAKFDFSEFSKVVNGSKGPFFEKAMARNKKFGNKNVFILTARPANSATAIHEFLKGIGLDIPLANITGLANSSPQAKANWVVGKASEGYNDFYFADDHIGNVKAVEQALSVLDVKSKVQQARISSSLDMSKEFNKYLEGSTGIDSFKNYKSDKARLKGRFKGKFDVFIPPSAEDFLGLLYKTINKGKQGEAQLKFYEDNLLKPYAKANSALRSARVRSIKEFNAIKKKLKIVPKDLKRSFKVEDENGNIKDSLFTKEQAIRVYIWNSQGIEMPNLSQVDLAIMVNEVNANPELKAFADELLKLNRGMNSKPPSKNWMDGNIGIDLQANLNSVGRKKLLEVWQQNVDAIFSEVNLNKLEAAYGPEYVKALESSLRRMRTGRSAAPVTDNEAGNNLIMWLNSAVGNIMFFNNRSALLQMLSATNFLNFEDNNIIAAGKAFANQPQYWKDFTMLMNSDYLLDRRDGTRININEADIALIAKQSGITGVIAKILELGFLPTKFADSLAIATGGATFYRTKVNALVKGGMSKAKAEAQAMQEFTSVAETSQQSSDQSKISMEQAGSVGKIILAFNNTSSQYSRIIKRSVQDLYNRRGNDKANLAKIIYYGGMQNLVFNFMQQAMFAAMWGGEDDEEVLDGKKAKIVNSMSDGLLRGMGVKAAIFVAIKNTAIKLYERSKKNVNKDYRYYAVMGMLAVSPPLSSKASKLSKAASAFQYGEDAMKYGKFSLDSPELAIGANMISFATSLPTDRLLVKAQNVSDALDASNEPWERLFMTMGWPKWTLSTKAESDLERKEDKTEIKEAKEKAEFDAMTPLEQKTKALEDLKKFQQVDSLKAYGLTDKEIRLLTREEDRVNKILSLEGSEKKGLTPADKAEEELYDLKKKQQVDSLTKYGLTKKQIRNLKYEEDRVNEILRLRKKKKRENSLK